MLNDWYYGYYYFALGVKQQMDLIMLLLIGSQ